MLFYIYCSAYSPLLVSFDPWISVWLTSHPAGRLVHRMFSCSNSFPFNECVSNNMCYCYPSRSDMGIQGGETNSLHLSRPQGQPKGHVYLRESLSALPVLTRFSPANWNSSGLKGSISSTKTTQYLEALCLRYDSLMEWIQHYNNEFPPPMQ